MAASAHVVCSLHLGILSRLVTKYYVAKLNVNYLRRRISIMRLVAVSVSQLNGIVTCSMVFYTRPSSSCVESVKKTRIAKIGAKIIAGSAFFTMRILC